MGILQVYHGSNQIVEKPALIAQNHTLDLTGVISRSATLEALKVRKLYNQIVFTSEKALSFLTFNSSYEVRHE